MKTIDKLIIVGVTCLTALATMCNISLGQEPIPRVATERLIGFTLSPNNVVRLEWDLDKDNFEDLRVYYYFRRQGNSAYTGNPFAYFQDLNENGNYEENEKFLFNGK